MLLNFTEPEPGLGLKQMMFLKEIDHLLVPGGPEAFDPNITIFKAMPGTCKIKSFYYKIHYLFWLEKCLLGAADLIG